MKLFFRPDPFRDSDGNLVQLDDIEIKFMETIGDDWGEPQDIWINFLDNKENLKFNHDFLIKHIEDLQKEIEEYYNLKYSFDEDYKNIHKLLRSKAKTKK